MHAHSGKGPSASKTAMAIPSAPKPHMKMASVSILTPFRKKEPIETRPVAKTTELGGVAAGNENAKAVAVPAGMSKRIGWMSCSTATEDRMGRMMLAVACHTSHGLRSSAVREHYDRADEARTRDG